MDCSQTSRSLSHYTETLISEIESPSISLQAMTEHDTAYCGAFATSAMEAVGDLDTLLSLSMSLSTPSFEDLDEDWVDLASESAELLWKLRSRLLQSECCDQTNCTFFGWILIQWELQWQEEITDVDMFLDEQLENYPGRYFARTLAWE